MLHELIETLLFQPVDTHLNNIVVIKYLCSLKI